LTHAVRKNVVEIDKLFLICAGWSCTYVPPRSRSRTCCANQWRNLRRTAGAGFRIS
jgi:hypothetical protein